MKLENRTSLRQRLRNNIFRFVMLVVTFTVCFFFLIMPETALGADKIKALRSRFLGRTRFHLSVTTIGNSCARCCLRLPWTVLEAMSIED